MNQEAEKYCAHCALMDEIASRLLSRTIDEYEKLRADLAAVRAELAAERLRVDFFCETGPFSPAGLKNGDPREYIDEAMNDPSMLSLPGLRSSSHG